MDTRAWRTFALSTEVNQKLGSLAQEPNNNAMVEARCNLGVLPLGHQAYNDKRQEHAYQGTNYFNNQFRFRRRTTHNLVGRITCNIRLGTLGAAMQRSITEATNKLDNTLITIDKKHAEMSGVLQEGLASFHLYAPFKTAIDENRNNIIGDLNKLYYNVSAMFGHNHSLGAQDNRLLTTGAASLYDAQGNEINSRSVESARRFVPTPEQKSYANDAKNAFGTRTDKRTEAEAKEQGKKDYKSDKRKRHQQQWLAGGSGDDMMCRIKMKTIHNYVCLLYTSPSPRDLSTSRMPSSA